MGPASIVCIRNLLSGGLILLWAKATAKPIPKGRDLWRTGGYGVLTIGMGNGTLAVAELWTPTGLASLFVTASTFWYATIDAMLPGGKPLHRPTLIGLFVGFLGALGLVAPPALRLIQSNEFTSGGGIVLGFILLQISGACWSLGSLLQRNRRLDVNPFVIGGVQQMATGLVFLLLMPLDPQPIVWDPRAIGAVLYLAIFGGIVGYGCYMLSLSRLPLAIVSTYTYINPVVAVFLGWLWYREPFGVREAAAMAVIFLGVWMVRRASAAQEKLAASQELSANSGSRSHQER